MKALSIRQPWASLIIDGVKDIENRTWRTKERGRILVHASKTYDYFALAWITGNQRRRNLVRGRWPTVEPQGALIGTVEVVECLSAAFYVGADISAPPVTPWWTGPYGYVLAHPIKFEKPIPCRGQLGFWTPPKDVWPPEVEDGDR